MPKPFELHYAACDFCREDKAHDGQRVVQLPTFHVEVEGLGEDVVVVSAMCLDCAEEVVERHTRKEPR